MREEEYQIGNQEKEIPSGEGRARETREKKVSSLEGNQKRKS